MIPPDWRASPIKRVQARLIAALGYRLMASLGSTLRWRTEGLEHFDRIVASGRQPIMAFWHGRILPATYYFRRRGIVVITSENFDGEWIAGIIERFGYRTARGSTSRGARKSAAAAEARHGGGEAGWIHARWAARSRARGAARRRLAGEGDRESGAAVSSGGRAATGRCEAGTARRSPSRSPRFQSRWASPFSSRRMLMTPASRQRASCSKRGFRSSSSAPSPWFAARPRHEHRETGGSALLRLS